MTAANPFYRVDPIRRYEIRGQVCPLKSNCTEPAPGTNISLIAGISGQRIRVMGLLAQSSSAATPAGAFQLISGSGGRKIIDTIYTPLQGALPFSLPVQDSGYDETDTGIGLFANITTTAQVLTIFYIAYAP